MKKINLSRRPYDLFLVIAILLVITSLLELDQQLDIHLHDRYFVFPIAYLYWSCVLLLMIFWGLYFILEKLKLQRFLTWLHVITTVLFFFLLIAGFFWPQVCIFPAPSVGPPVYFFLDDYQDLTVGTAIPLLFVFGQLCLLLNVFIGLGVHVRNVYTDNSKRHS